MRQPFNPHSTNPYFNAADNKHYPIASDPISDPPSSSTTVHIRCLKDWEYDWYENHDECGDGIWEPRSPEDFCEPRQRLTICNICNEPRPINKNVSSTVTPMSGDFVTINDYSASCVSMVDGFERGYLDGFNCLW